MAPAKTENAPNPNDGETSSTVAPDHDEKKTNGTTAATATSATSVTAKTTTTTTGTNKNAREEEVAEDETGTSKSEANNSSSTSTTTEGGKQPSTNGEENPTATATATAASSKIIAKRPPKRARTAYFIFADDMRPQIQKDHPGEGVASQAKRIGAKWQSVSDTEKDKYKEISAREKEAFAAAMEAYKEQHGDDDPFHLNGGDNTDTNHDLVFPVARIRKIAKLDPDVKTLSKEALQLVVKTTELVLARLGRETVKVARMHNRRTLLADDVASVCAHREAFRFLEDDIKDLTKALAASKKKSSETTAAGTAVAVSKKEVAKLASASGSKPLTSYFGAVASNK